MMANPSSPCRGDSFFTMLSVTGLSVGIHHHYQMALASTWQKQPMSNWWLHYCILVHKEAVKHSAIVSHGQAASQQAVCPRGAFQLHPPQTCTVGAHVNK